MTGEMNGKKPARSVIEKPRARRDAARMLGIALQTRYRRLLEASGEDEIVMATADLAQCMYDNVEFVIWTLKSQGGLNPAPPPALLHRAPVPAPPANDSKPETVLDLPCSCPPLEHGILFRERHMTSCPKFVP